MLVASYYYGDTMWLPYIVQVHVHAIVLCEKYDEYKRFNRSSK